MEMTGNHFLTTYRECPLQRHFRYQYAERKRLFPESPKTGTSENQPIYLAPDVFGFQKFHCIRN
jgi:hypothetical protein